MASERNREEQATFGENLRREREMRGISLEEISASTKISVRFLEALESNDFSILPGGIFTRGFIRSYARYLGLDGDHVIAEYQLLVQPRSEMEITRAALGRIGTSRPSKRSPAAPLLVALVLLVGGYALFRYAHRSPEPAGFPASAPVATTTAAPATASGAPGASSPAETANQNAASLPDSTAGSPPGGANPAAQAGSTAVTGAESNPAAAAPSGQNPANTNALAAGPPAGTRPEPGATGTAGTTGAPASALASPPTYPVLGQGNLILQLAATEPTWIDVEADGKTELQKTLKPEEVRTVRAREYFEITTGNAAGLVLTLDGETLKPLGKRGEVKKVRLTAADAKPPAPLTPN